MASQELGGLGADDSAPAVCQVPQAWPIWESLPCLLLGGLWWSDRRRRLGDAWILLALAAGCSLLWGVARTAVFLPGELTRVLLPVLQSLVFGHAVLWLASARLAHPRWTVVGARMFGSVVVGSAALLCASIDVMDAQVALPSFIILLVGSAISVVGLQLAGWWRGRGARLGGFAVVATVAWCAILTGLVWLGCLLGDGRVWWGPGLAVGGALSGSLALGLFPLLAVLFLHPRQRERLRELLRLDDRREVAPGSREDVDGHRQRPAAGG